MSRFFAIAVAATLAACMGMTAWSQSGQSGGGGASGGAGTSGSAGSAGTAGTAGSAGTAGAAGTAGTPGTTGQAGTAGAAGSLGAAGTAGGGQFSSGVVGEGQFGASQNQFGAQAGANFNNGFGGISQTPFFADPGARRQLNLNANQFNQLNRAYGTAWQNYQQSLTQLQNNPNLSEQQRQQQMMELENRFNQNFGRTVDTTFTNPNLRSRFNQLDMQFQGVNAFRNPQIRQQLNLTREQERAFSRLASEWRRQLAQLRRAGNDQDPAVVDQQYSLMLQQYQQQLNSILTPQQQQVYAQMIGQQYQFPWSAYVERPGPGQPVPQVPKTTAGNVGTDASGDAQQVPRTGSAQGTGTQNQGGTQGTVR